MGMRTTPNEAVNIMRTRRRTTGLLMEAMMLLVIAAVILFAISVGH